VFVCLRLFYLLLNEEMFLLQYKCCIETRFSRYSSQEFAGFMVIVWLIQLSEYVGMLTCQGKSFNFSHYVVLIKPRFHRSSGIFVYMWELPFILVFTCLFSWYFKIVWPSLFFASEHRQSVAVINVIVVRKREQSQKPNLCLWEGLEIFLKNLRKEKIPRQIIFTSISIKAFKRYVPRFLKSCP